MLDKLKISRGFTVPNGYAPDIYVVSQGKSRAIDDYPCVILWAKDWERIRAVVEAAIHLVEQWESTASTPAAVQACRQETMKAADDLRAHMESSDGKG